MAEVTDTRLQAILCKLAANAGFKVMPTLMVAPLDGDLAGAIVDLHLVQAAPSLAGEDDNTVRCILAHELGHLWFRHGRGEVLKALGLVGVAVIGAIIGWAFIGPVDGAIIGAGIIGCRYLSVAARTELYRQGWATNKRERQADDFAEKLVGKPAFDAFRQWRIIRTCKYVHALVLETTKDGPPPRCIGARSGHGQSGP